MKVTSRPFIQIDRTYIITSGELKRVMKIEGEIHSVDLYSGRSPTDIQNGKNPDTDEWVINTSEKKRRDSKK